jgi:autotransporter-associated beta strand protein
LNYAGKFDATLPADGTGSHFHAHSHVEAVHATHAPSDAIIIPDAQLLFNGDFKRSGVDLILSKDDHEQVLHDYFKGEKHAPLASPDGAYLTGDIVDALTGHVQYAQADGSVSVSHIIGHVTKLAGSAAAIRNGVSIILNAGDNVEKGDVVQSGSNSTLGITFIDGTIFALSSNSRMVLNEMVYDPNGSNNSALLSLVAGTISFVAGQTAKHGDMKIDTPVATMGIRGTAGLVGIEYKVPVRDLDPGADYALLGPPTALIQILVEPDGTTGNLIVFDKATLAPIATLNDASRGLYFSNGNFSIINGLMTIDQQKLINDLFAQQHTDADTKSIIHYTSVGIPDQFVANKLPDGTNPIGQPFILLSLNGLVQPTTTDPPRIVHIPGKPDLAIVNGAGQLTADFAVSELTGKTGDTLDKDTVSGIVRFADINAPDLPTVSMAKDAAGNNIVSFTYQDANHNALGLNPLQAADIAAVEVNLQVVQNPGNKNTGFATWTYSVADGAFDFLAAGEKLTLTYTARVDNNYLPNDEFSTQTFTITITGTNDAPVITTGPQAISFIGGTTTSGGPLTTADQTSGTLAFTDVDLTDTHTVSASLTSAVLSGSSVLTGSLAAFEAAFPTPAAAFEAALTASIASGNDSTGTGAGTINWKLADLPAYLADFVPAGQTLTLTYAVTVTDSQNATYTQDVTVTITGNNTPAFVWIETTATAATEATPGDWNVGSHWETGTVPTIKDDAIIITDQLQGLTPYYPVTINAAASAKSVTMNDFGATAPELDNNSTLTIANTFDLIKDAIVKNAGTISVGGLMEVLNASTVTNSGTLTLAEGGDFKDQSTISNTIGGKIELSGGTLNVQVGIANAGLVAIDSGATLALNGAAIDGGTVTNKANGTIDLTGSGVLKNGSLGNAGTIDVSGIGNALDGETVTANNILEVLSGGALLFDLGTTVANGGGTITVDGTGTLTLNGATITGGTVTNKASGIIDLTGGGIVNTGSLGNAGQINVSGIGNALDGETVTANNALEILAGGALLIDLGSTVANGGGTITIDGTGTLTLNGATITGGTVTNKASGTIDLTGGGIVNTGSLGNAGQINVSGIGNALDGETVTANNALEILAGGALLIDQGSTIANGGIVTVDGTGTLTLNGATITGGTVTNKANGTIDLTGGGIVNTGSLGNAGQINVSGIGNALDKETITSTGNIDVSGALIIDQVSTLDNTGGGTVTVDSTGTLTLDHATITAGTITDNGTLDLTGTAVLKNGTLGNTHQINVSGTGNELYGETVTANNALEILANSALLIDHGTTVTNGGTITVDGTGTLTLSGATITGGTVIDNGTIDVISDSTIDSNISLGGLIKVEDNSTLTLYNALSIGIETVTLAGTNAILDDSAGLSLAGGTIGGSGNLAADTNLAGYGTVSIPLDSADQVTASGGTLEFTTAVDSTTATAFDIAAAANSVLKFDAAVGTASTNPTVTFEGSDNGAGVLDLTAISLSDFHGVIANFDEGEAIDVQYAASAVLDNTGRVLTVFDSSGTALGSIGFATSYTGDTFNVSNGVITVDDLAVTLDATKATEGITINVTAVTDDGASVAANVAYSWQTLDSNGHWNEVGSGSNYTPTETDEGQSLRLVTTYAADPSGSESTTVNLGTVADTAPVITSTSESASLIGVNLVTNGGFESGNFSGWALSGNTAFTLVSSSDSHGGAYDAWLGPVGSDGHLTQNISTVAGQHYTLDFWLANDGGVQNDFSVSWNGTTLSPHFVNLGSQPYTEYQYDVIGGASSSALEFTFRQDPAYLHLDDISVTPDDLADGTIGFTDPKDTHTASFTPAGQAYIGTFSLGAVNEVNGTGSVDWHFSATTSELQQFLNPAAGHPITQTYDVAISDGHSAGTVLQEVGLTFGSSANDTFVFAPGAGQEVLFNFSQQSGNTDHIELDHFGISNFSQLTLQSVNSNHDTLVNLGHNDSLLVVGISAANLHASDFILHA